MLKSARYYLHSSGQNTGTWRADRRTDLPWLLQRSALRAMRTRCKRRVSTGHNTTLKPTRSAATAEIARASGRYAFKVIQGHWCWYQSKALLVNNNIILTFILSRTVSQLSIIRSIGQIIVFDNGLPIVNAFVLGIYNRCEYRYTLYCVKTTFVEVASFQMWHLQWKILLDWRVGTFTFSALEVLRNRAL